MIDKKELIDCTTNAVKSNIIYLLQKNGESTAKEMLCFNREISQATLYRMLNRLTEAGIIEVVAENKVRAMTEKVYALSKEFHTLSQTIAQENNRELYLGLFSKFILEITREFKEYVENAEELNPAETGFSSVQIHATSTELAELSGKMQELLLPYLTLKSKDQQSHTLALIVGPSKQVGEE